MHDEQGFSLVEVVMAIAVVSIVTISVSTALLAGRTIAAHDRAAVIGRVAAQARLTTLTSLAFQTIAGAGGAPLAITDTTTDVAAEPPGPGGSGLQESPADALWVDRAGYVDYLDGLGRGIGTGARARARAAYVRRWAIGRQGPGGAGQVVTVAVLVAPMAAAARAAAGDPTRLGDASGVVVRRGARSRHAS